MTEEEKMRRLCWGLGIIGATFILIGSSSVFLSMIGVGILGSGFWNHPHIRGYIDGWEGDE